MQAALQLRRDYILYTESDQQGFFEWGLRDFMARAPSQSQVGVIAARSAASFGTYPASQQYTETVIN